MLKFLIGFPELFQVQMSLKMSTKICHICQDFADHDTASCPNSVCKVCKQRGHVSKTCPKTLKSVSLDEALLPFSAPKEKSPTKVFLTNYKRPESPTFQPRNKVRKLDACPDLEWAKNEDFSEIPLNIPVKRKQNLSGGSDGQSKVPRGAPPPGSDVLHTIVKNDLGLREISQFIDQVSSATSDLESNGSTHSPVPPPAFRNR